MNNKGKATDVAAEGSLHPIPAIPSGRDGARRYAATVWSLILLTGSLPLMAAPPARVRVISQSGQFIVHGLPMAPAASSSAAVEYLRVDPNLVAVSLDRIRGAIYDELRLANEWRGRITVVTEPVVSEDSRVEITAARFQDGWGYRLVLPELVQRKRFLDAAVNVILLEVANRHASERKAELPLWLVQGLSAEIEATAFSTLALEPGAEVNRRGRNPDAVFYGGMDATGGPLLKQGRELGIKAVFSFGDGACTDKMKELAGDAAEGLLCSRKHLERLLEGRGWPVALEGWRRELLEPALTPKLPSAPES